MTGPGKHERFRKNAEEALRLLHKRLGIRRGDLLTQLGPELCQIWNIEKHEHVQEQMIVRLEEILSGIGDRTLVLIARVGYNIEPNPETRHLDYGDRLEKLHNWLGKKHSPRSCGRKREIICEQYLVPALGKQWPPVASAALRRVIDREKRNSTHTGVLDNISIPAPVVPTQDEGLRTKIRGLRNPDTLAEQTIESFLHSRVHVPCGPPDTPAVVHTKNSGDWVCVFYSETDLRLYQRETKTTSWTGRNLRITGTDLLQKLIRHELRAGILINPSAEVHAELPETLFLTADEVHRIGRNLGTTPTQGP